VSGCGVEASLSVVGHGVEGSCYPGYRGPCTPGIVGCRLQPKNWDTTGSLQHHTARKPNTPYWIKAPPLLAEAEGLPTLKELNSGVIHVSTYPTSIYMGGPDFTTCQPSPPNLPGSGHTRAPESHARGLSTSNKHQQSRVLGKRQHLIPGMTRCDNRHPHAPDSRYLSTGSHPITI
jgi:hypothetical protein